jgi:hypothetical protein
LTAVAARAISAIVSRANQITMRTQTTDLLGASGKKSANRLSPDGKWRSFPRVPHLLQYVSSGTYFARIKIKGKLIRESLGTG